MSQIRIEHYDFLTVILHHKSMGQAKVEDDDSNQ